MPEHPVETLLNSDRPFPSCRNMAPVSNPLTIRQETKKAERTNCLQNDTGQAVYSLRPGLEILPVADNQRRPQARLVVAGDKYYQVDGTAALVLVLLQNASASIAQLQRAIASTNKQCDDDEKKLRETLSRLAARQLITDGTDIPAQAVTNKRKKRRASYFAFYLRLLPPDYVRPITRVLSPLFSPTLFVFLLPAMAIGQIYLWFFHLKAAPALYHLPGGVALLELVIANYAGLLLHELGHATACARFGAKHGEIGFALYLVFPALYTDVTDAWRLTQKQRVMVDSGGIYMSLLAATLASVLYLQTGSAVAAQMCCVYDITVLLNLNPFFRMDGYWILSDVLGIPNLMGLAREMSGWLVRAPFRSVPHPTVLNLPRALRFAYLGYYLGFLLFVAYLIHRFFAWYIPHVLISYPGLAHEIMRRASTQGISGGLLKDIFRLIVQAVPLAGPTVYLGRFIKRRLQEKSDPNKLSGQASFSEGKDSLPAT